jgi:hypothetical protein
MVYGCFVLFPGVLGFLATVACGITRQLDIPASGDQDHTTSLYAS